MRLKNSVFHRISPALAVLAIAMASIVPARAASVSVSLPFTAISHPIRTAKHPVQAFHESSAEKWTMLASLITIESANGIDYATTHRGVITGVDCEENPLFQTGPCRYDSHNINVPRFTGVKIGIAALGAMEYAPKLFGWHSETWNRTMILINFAGALPMAITDVNNIRVLTGH